MFLFRVHPSFCCGVEQFAAQQNSALEKRHTKKIEKRHGKNRKSIHYVGENEGNTFDKGKLN